MAWVHAVYLQGIQSIQWRASIGAVIAVLELPLALVSDVISCLNSCQYSGLPILLSHLNLQYSFEGELRPHQFVSVRKDLGESYAL